MGVFSTARQMHLRSSEPEPYVNCAYPTHPCLPMGSANGFCGSAHYAWSRILQGVMLDPALAQLGYDADKSKRLSPEQLMAHSQRIPGYIEALLLLELLY